MIVIWLVQTIWTGTINFRQHVSVMAISRQIYFPANAIVKAADDAQTTWTPTMHVGGLPGLSGSQLPNDPSLAIVPI